jgi:hypothetical protein
MMILSSFQWTLFILANSIVAPLSVGLLAAGTRGKIKKEAENRQSA